MGGLPPLPADPPPPADPPSPPLPPAPELEDVDEFVELELLDEVALPPMPPWPPIPPSPEAEPDEVVDLPMVVSGAHPTASEPPESTRHNTPLQRVRRILRLSTVVATRISLLPLIREEPLGAASRCIVRADRCHLSKTVRNDVDY